ncbi:MAG: hypothetical protein A4E29_00019 [Methanomassiliicoccales archaeon PtaB.Bin134]|nr:MAG: hypothetical protein A4E29_00019 [Methanomassiliicoccales archaeon PtaB.Bin134]
MVVGVVRELVGGFTIKALAIFFAIISCTCVAPSIAADSDGGTTTVQSGYYMALPIDASMVIKISYSVDVISGPNIDVILTDSTGYSQYTSSSLSFQYLPDGSRLNTKHASASVDVDSGRWYLIIDNTDRGSAVPSGQNAVVEYSVVTSVSGFSTGDGEFIRIEAVIALCVIVAIIIIAIIVAYVFSKKKRSRHLQTQYPAICPNCGRPMMPGSMFCEGCGRRLI